MKKAKVYKIIVDEERSNDFRIRSEVYQHIITNFSAKSINLVLNNIKNVVDDILIFIAGSINIIICNIDEDDEEDVYHISFNKKQFEDAWKLL